ncbi:chemotaxis protein CheX [Candidatus Eisenbacteria bacterium]|uniref:Chemotaxis protein CheX n=1 Tax=Eiseniibacteriota bacterium TaxID=2212470 RepID=A0ABV6YII8_UNCEI
MNVSHMQMQQDLVRPFVEGVRSTMSTMAGLEPVERCVEIAETGRFHGDITALMGLTGKSGEGFVGITLESSLAQLVVSKILGLDPGELEPIDITDGVGELINMIAGTAKSILNGTQYQFNCALPNVITGPGHEVGYPKDAGHWRITLELEGKPLHLHVVYARK